jgi:NifU-like protein involved in Fe-S cluster formation
MRLVDQEHRDHQRLSLPSVKIHCSVLAEDAIGRHRDY